MIKINLLGVAPPSAKPAMGAPAPVVTQVVMFLGALIVCFGIVGVLYKVWDSEQQRLQREQKKEQVRKAELAAVQTQNAQYQRYLQVLETRFNTMQALQASRVGPVELMNSLGNVVNTTNDVYLYTLAPSGDRLELKGQSNTVDSMASFMASLKKSGTFDDVRLEQFYEDDQHEHVTYKFALSCQFVSPTAGNAPAAGGAPAGPAGRPGGLPGVPAQVQQGLKRGL